MLLYEAKSMNWRMCSTINNNREIVFSFCHECGTRKQVYYTTRSRVSDVCILRLRSSTETLRWASPWSGWTLKFLRFLYRVQNLSFCHSVHKSSGDSLEKLDQVEGLVKDAVENCNSFLETCKDVNPMEGHTINWLFFKELIILLISW